MSVSFFTSNLHTHTHTWEQRVLYAEHGWSVSICHGLHDLLFGQVPAPIFDTNPCFQVVEMAAVQLKELNQQHAQILVGVPGVDTWMELKERAMGELISMD